MPVYIYALSEPDTGAIRYIGKSVDPAARYRAHISLSQLKDRTHKNHWIKSLLKRGLLPVMTIVEETDNWTWEQAERSQIAAHKLAGCNLTNGTAGGAVFPANHRRYRPRTRSRPRALKPRPYRVARKRA